MKRYALALSFSPYLIALLLAVSISAPAAHAQWTAPVNLGPSMNTQYSEFHMAISADELSLFFASDRPGGFGDFDIWVAQRGTQSGDWEPATNLGASFNTDLAQVGLSLSPDEHWLYFSTVGVGHPHFLDIFAAFRADTTVQLRLGTTCEFG